jgi:hypothetical protein
MFTHGNTLHLPERGKRKYTEQYQENALHDVFAIPKLAYLQKKSHTIV